MSIAGETELETEAPSREEEARIPLALFGLFVFALVGLIIWQARSALAPYLLGLFFVYLLLPVVRWIEARLPERWMGQKARRGIASVVTTIGTMALALILFGVLFKPVVEETVDIFENFGGYWAEVQAQNETFRDTYQAITPDPIEEWINANIGRLGRALIDGATGFVVWLVNAGGSLVSTAMAVFAVPLFIIYYMMEEPNTSATLRRQLPRAWSEDLIAGFRIFDRIFGTYSRGVILEAAIVGVITGGGYWLIGVDLAVPLGIIAFAGEIVPILGPWIAFAVSFPVVLATQPELAIPAIGLFLVIQLLEGWLLAPKIQGESVEFTAAGTLIILAIGGALFGAVGVVFALPAAAIVRAALGYTHYRLKGSAPDEALAQIRPFRVDEETATWPD